MSIIKLVDRSPPGRTRARDRKAELLLARLSPEQIDRGVLTALARIYGWRAHVAGDTIHAVITDIPKNRARELAGLLEPIYDVAVSPRGRRLDVHAAPTVSPVTPLARVRVWHNVTLDDRDHRQDLRSYQPAHRMAKVFDCLLPQPGGDMCEAAEVMFRLINNGPALLDGPARSLAADYWSRGLRPVRPGDVISVDGQYLVFDQAAGFRRLDHGLVAGELPARTRPHART